MKSFLHPFSVLAEYEHKGGHIYKSGNGVYLTDTKGHEVLDGFSGLWCVNLGYSRADIVKAASRQMEALPYACSFFNESSDAVIELSDKLADKLPGNLNHSFFTLGGSDADDSAIKIALYYHAVNGQTERRHIISLQGSYHGSSWAGAGMSGIPGIHDHFAVPLATQHHIPSHYHCRENKGDDPQTHINAAVADLETKIDELGADKVAAFICELIQGAGGIIVPPDGLIPALREVCRKYGILFVVDEVITGFCRTGTYFGCEYEGIEPDIITLAKGLTSGYAPMGAAVISEEIYQTIVNEVPEGKTFNHGFTYSGHPVSAAIALQCMHIYETEVLLRVAQTGNYFQQCMREFADHPWVGDIRGRGMVLALELVKDKTSNEPFVEIGDAIRNKAYENGLRPRVFANGSVGFAPALIYTEAEIDLLVERFTKTLNDLWQQGESLRLSSQLKTA